jgi:hypothetical protein
MYLAAGLACAISHSHKRLRQRCRLDRLVPTTISLVTWEGQLTHGAKCFCLAELSFAVHGD